MRRTILILVAILTALFAQSQNISGQWSGKLGMHGREITVVFDIQKSNSGYVSTMYNAAQGKCGLESNSVSVFDSIVTIRFTDAKIELFGSITDANTFLGAIKQNNELFPIVLNKGKIEISKIKKTIIRRPESVKQVYSYYNEEVVFENKLEKMAIVGKLSMPICKNNIPAVILICDTKYLNTTTNDMAYCSNYQGNNNEKIVDYLTSCGVAVFRFECRKNSTDNFAPLNSTSTDVDAIISYLKTRRDVNSEKIKLIEQSDCGLLDQIMVAIEGNNTVSELPDLKQLFSNCKRKSDLFYVEKSNQISQDTLYQMGKWVLQTN